MPHRIVVSSDLNAEGEKLRKGIRDDLGIVLDDVRILDLYTLDEGLDRERLELPLSYGMKYKKAELKSITGNWLTPNDLNRLGAELFSDAVTQRYYITDCPMDDFDAVFEVGYRPGVTDNVGDTAKNSINNLLGKKIGVNTSRRYVLKGKLSESDIGRIGNYLYNPLIQIIEYRSASEWRQRPTEILVPKVVIEQDTSVKTIDLRVSDDDLLRISSEMGLALNLQEMKELQQRYGTVSDFKLEQVAARWSEHCLHKILRGGLHYYENGRHERVDSLFDTYIRGATEAIMKMSDIWRKRLPSVFSDNAGVIDIGNGYYIAFKVETHNYPSALDPENGADTGTAVVRDIFGTGISFRPIAYTDILCFADPQYSGEVPRFIYHPKRVFEGVRRGIEHGGNKKGIPTVNGTVRFDSYPFGSVEQIDAVQSYMGRPIVYCGCLGIAPSEINGRPAHIKKADPGDLVVLIGGGTGKDGFHGATGSSETLHEGSPATAVQIASSIMEKRNIDLLMESRNKGLYKSLTDCGAGGRGNAIGEIAEEAGGVEVDFSLVPLKYTGLKPYEIAFSESQEQAILAVSPDKFSELEETGRRHGVPVTSVGRFTGTGKYVALYNGKVISDIDLDFLNHGAPKKVLKAVWKEPVFEEPEFKKPDIDWALENLLSRLNLCSKEYVVRQYDHEVQGGTIGKPMTGIKNDGPSDAAVLWPIEMRRARDGTGLVIANGINSNYGLIDTYHMAANNIDEAIRNAVAAGADPDFIVLLDNFCWSSSDNEYRLAQLYRATKACYDYTTKYLTPFVSGKDSMFNDYNGELSGVPVKISAPPTLLISALGRISDVRNFVTMDAKQPGNIIYVIGDTKPELGGSEYYALMGSMQKEAWVGNGVPKVNAVKALASYRKLHRAIKSGMVYSCHDCSEGGVLPALAESAFSGGVGMKVYLEKVPSIGVDRDDYVSFAESASRFVVEVPEAYAAKFERIMKGSSYAAIGKTTKDERMKAYGLSGKEVANSHIQDLKDSWQRALRW